MSRYREADLLQGVRVRSWTGGRLATLKLMIQRLEEELNSLAPASVEQSNSRVFDDLVPFILDLTVAAGYRQFTIEWSEPPGLASTHPNRQLLFYEIWHDTTQAFSDPTIIETPQRQILISGAKPGEVRYFKGRVINTRFEASRWSTIVTSTGAQGVFEQTDIDDVSVRIITDVGEWQTIFTKVYDPFNGAVMLNTHLALGAIQENVTVSHKTTGRIVKTFNSGPAFVQCRYLWDDKEFGQRTMLSSRPGYTGDYDGADPADIGKSPMGFGTFISEFIRPGNDEITFKLQATKCPGSEWKGGGKQSGDRPTQISDPLIMVRRGLIFEVLENL